MDGQWQEASIIDMDAIVPGNEVTGLAIIEAPSTTLVLPPGRKVRMDEWSLLWLT
jgi:N-methylhydantoinase A/oxoprolinase/acetone carboxylase beta subunit